MPPGVALDTVQSPIGQLYPAQISKMIEHPELRNPFGLWVGIDGLVYALGTATLQPIYVGILDLHPVSVKAEEFVAG